MARVTPRSEQWWQRLGRAEPPSQVLPQRVRELREQQSWTQQDLAERLTALGIAFKQPKLARLEAGTRGVDVDELVAIAFVLGVEPMRLLDDVATMTTRAQREMFRAIIVSAEGQLRLLRDQRDSLASQRAELDEQIAQAQRHLRELRAAGPDGLLPLEPSTPATTEARRKR